MAADAGADARPVLRNLSGNWALDAAQSESTDAVLEAMGAGLVARSLLARLATRLELWQSPSSLLLREVSALGAFTRTVIADGRWHAVPQLAGPPAPVRAAVSRSTGDVTVESALPRGLLVEHFSLMRRTELGHVRDFFAGADARAIADARGERVPTASAVNVWARVETEEERVAGEEAEQAAVDAAGRSAVSMTLGFSAYAGGDGDVAPRAAAAGGSAAPSPRADARAAAGGSLRGESPRGVTAPTPRAALVGEAGGSAASAGDGGGVDFSGSWAVDTAASRDTLRGILTLMGVPWLAVEVALSLDVITVIAHDVAGGAVETVERTSLGVIARNALRADGVRVAQTGADGRVAHVACSVRGGAAVGAGFLGAMRIVTELPDALGVTDNEWRLRVGGGIMEQTITFTRDGKAVTALRTLVNRDAPRAANLALAGAAAAGARTEDADPFFAGVAGVWCAAAPAAALPLAALPLAALSAAARAVLLRLLPGGSAPARLDIAHAPGVASGLLPGLGALPLDDEWRAVPLPGAGGGWVFARAAQARGAGGGDILGAPPPPADAPRFFYSSLPFDAAACAAATLRAEVLLAVADAPPAPPPRAAPRLALTLALAPRAGDAQSAVTLDATLAVLAADGAVVAAAPAAALRLESGARAVAAAHAARVRHCRALVLAARGSADVARNAELARAEAAEGAEPADGGGCAIS